MKKTEGAMPLDRVLAFPVLVGLAAALLGMLLGACAVKAGRADMGSIPALAVSALCVGVLRAARRATGCSGGSARGRLCCCAWCC